MLHRSRVAHSHALARQRTRPLRHLQQIQGLFARRRRERTIDFGKIVCVQLQRAGSGIGTHMRRRSGFGNGDDIAAADGPRKRHRSGRNATTLADGVQDRMIQQRAAAKRRIRHHGYLVRGAPGQQVEFDAAAASVVQHLVDQAMRAAIDCPELLHVIDVEVRHAPIADLAGIA